METTMIQLKLFEMLSEEEALIVRQMREHFASPAGQHNRPDFILYWDGSLPKLPRYYCVDGMLDREILEIYRVAVARSVRAHATLSSRA